MAKILTALLLLTAALPLAAQSTALPTNEEWLGEWKISRQFTLDVADKMPAEFYSFKPTSEQMSFGEQMNHIALSLVYRFWQISGLEPPFQKPDRADKETAVKLLAQAYDYVLATIPKITPEQMRKSFKVDWKGRTAVNAREMMMNMFVHAAHHRAECEVYLRLKGITPPVYTF